jgi:hypothetical protein
MGRDSHLIGERGPAAGRDGEALGPRADKVPGPVRADELGLALYVVPAAAGHQDAQCRGSARSDGQGRGIEADVQIAGFLADISRANGDDILRRLPKLVGDAGAEMVGTGGWRGRCAAPVKRSVERMPRISTI